MKNTFSFKRLGGLFTVLIALITVFTVSPAYAESLPVTLAAVPVATNFEAITKWAGQYSKKILTEYLNKMDLFAQNQVDRAVSKHGKLLPKVKFTRGIRPLDTGVTRNNYQERSFGGRKIFVYPQMKLFYYEPDEVRGSFLADMLKPGAKTMPMAEWFWREEMRKLAQEINDYSFYQVQQAEAAAFNPSATYTAGAYMKFTDKNYYKCLSNTSAGESPVTHAAKWEQVNHLVSYDGFGTIIAAEIAADEGIVVIPTGSITSENAHTKVHLMYKGLASVHRSAGGKVKMGPDTILKYLDHRRAIYGNTATMDIMEGKYFIEGSGGKWTIEVCSWMGSSQMIIFDVEGKNLTVGTDLASMPGVTKSVETLHGTESVAKWDFGCQINDIEVLYVNDQA